MPTLRIICLANSRKLGGRCVAGIRVDGGGWVRPVSKLPDGTLNAAQYTLDDGSVPQLLDIMEIGVDGPRPADRQPENWLIDGMPWRLLRRPGTEEEISVIWDHVIEDPLLFGNRGDRVPENQDVEYSLALVKVRGLRWRITTNIRGERQTRTLFTLGDVQYDLVVTDCVIEQNLNGLGYGIHPVNSAPGFTPKQEVLLTISLGEPLEGYCYKLVAGVIPLPRLRQNLESLF